MKDSYNYQKIAISNIFQQIISILTTIILIKNIGSELYSEVVYFLTIGNTLIIFASCWINPFFIREGTLDFKNNKNFKESMISIFISITIYLLLLVISKNLIFEKIINNYEFLAIIFLHWVKYYHHFKNTFRIKEVYLLYYHNFRKVIFFIFIFIYFRITSDNKFQKFCYNYNACYWLEFFLKIRNDIYLKLPNKFYKKYLLNSFYFIATLVVYFSSFEYLIIITL